MAENRELPSYESESGEENGDWEDWREDEDGLVTEDDSEFVCLFCDSNYGSCDSLFEHCRLSHWFDFHGIRKALNLDFYSSFKLINYVRSQVAENKYKELQNQLNEKVNYQGIECLWNDDKYLKPFLEDDPLLYSFEGEEEDEDDIGPSLDKEELMRDLQKIEGLNIVDESVRGNLEINNDTSDDKRSKNIASISNGNVNVASPVDGLKVNNVDSQTHSDSSDNGVKLKLRKVCDGNLDIRGIKKVNENYFGSYSSFGIHREMISDKARTDAYRQALSENPSLLKGAVVMDVGCGTGILSLFAAQAGASRVIAVEASEKMAKVAAQIAGDNGLLHTKKTNEGVIEVAQCMVEELDKTFQIQPHSIDVLVSEWMGYCLLYESMLNSVLYARDRWLKPGGSVLPDTATIFVAGFGKGGTSLAFWENVYGFNMSSIGKELLEDAARNPIVDGINASDLVTGSSVLQTFDLATMKQDEVDFTSMVELEPINPEPNTTWCYGVVLWFDTGFTSRFCKENPTVLSTSPHTLKTHWSQTVFTFQEPIAIAPSVKNGSDGSGDVGTDACPASRIHLRMSIAHASEHRCIDISVETTAIDPCGRKRTWPVQLFNLS